MPGYYAQSDAVNKKKKTALEFDIQLLPLPHTAAADTETPEQLILVYLLCRPYTSMSLYTTSVSVPGEVT